MVRQSIANVPNDYAKKWLWYNLTFVRKLIVCIMSLLFKIFCYCSSLMDVGPSTYSRSIFADIPKICNR